LLTRFVTGGSIRDGKLNGTLQRIPLRQKIGKKIEELLGRSLAREGDVTSTVIGLGVERLVQEMLEQEVTDHLEREHYDRRRSEQEHRGYRNGYERGRIRTAEEVTYLSGAG
jgi:transposase-like protein